MTGSTLPNGWQRCGCWRWNEKLSMWYLAPCEACHGTGYVKETT